MVDRLRLFFDRPLADADRPRLFAVTVAVLVGIVVILTVLDDPGLSPERRQSAAHRSPAAGSVTTAVTYVSTPAPSEESNLSTQASRADVSRSKRAARRFLSRYLQYAYGRTSASSLVAVTPELRAELADQRPRVPASERRRRPRVELLQTNGVNGERAELLALVRDGKRRYSLHLELANTPSGWLVTALER